MGSLILDSLEISNFRAFEHLSIERLGRVNLITGKNGVGKSALLEAIWLYARRATPNQLLELLDVRDELRDRSRRPISGRSEEDAEEMLNIKHLFHGRTSIDTAIQPIRIGPLSSQDKVLTISIAWLRREITDEGGKLIPVSAEEHAYHDDVTPYIIANINGKAVHSYPLSTLLRPQRFGTTVESIPSVHIKTNGLPISQMSQLWDKVALTPSEDDVIRALNIIAQSVRRVTFLGDDDVLRGRIPVVTEDSSIERLPLRSLGEGMSRLFGIALALVNTREGILLIDEVESGLHYSVLPDVFKLIFRVAQQLNVQVFATTHSWECIEAFQRAAAEDYGEQAMLIRLQNRKSGVVPTLLDEEELGIATRELIEVR